MSVCPTCGRHNEIVNQRGCDPHNLPTLLPRAGGWMRARFWVWWRDGWVKLTLTKDQTRAASTFERDEEGYSFNRESWTFDGHSVRRDWERGGRDCDGRISHSGADECPLAHLMSGATEDKDIDGAPLYRPEWQEAEDTPTLVNDEYARAMNY